MTTHLILLTVALVTALDWISHLLNFHINCIYFLPSINLRNEMWNFMRYMPQWICEWLQINHKSCFVLQLVSWALPLQKFINVLNFTPYDLNSLAKKHDWVTIDEIFPSHRVCSMLWFEIKLRGTWCSKKQIKDFYTFGSLAFHQHLDQNIIQIFCMFFLRNGICSDMNSKVEIIELCRP